jgi:hypothetical protein
MKETYIGDGLYVSMHEGANTMRIRTPRVCGSGAQVDHEVYLGPAELQNLLEWVSQHWDVIQWKRNPRTT